MRTLSRKFFAIGLLLALLVCSTGRAVPVFALADPVQVVAPVFDTEIIRLSDYVEHNLTDSQLDTFFILSGALVVLQAGAQDVLLEMPYENESNVKEWLINCGVQIYNTLIGLVPSGDYYIGIPIPGLTDTRIKGIPREQIKGLVAQMMGNAVVAKNYPNVEQFLESEEQTLMPFQRDLQVSINAIWQLQGGPYHWQFDTAPFESNTFVWTSTPIPALSNYWSLYADIPFETKVKANTYPIQGEQYYNCYLYHDFFETYTNLFINTATGKYYLLDDHGQSFGNISNPSWYTFNCNYLLYANGRGFQFNTSFQWYTARNYPANLDTFQEVAQYIFDNDFGYNSQWTINQADFVKHVYVGTNWIDKQELYNVSGLNISEDMNDYYESPTSDDLLVDIKNLINDLVDTTNIWDTIINNIYDPDGNHVLNMPTIRVSVDLTPITDLLAPPLPVNLNEIAEYTDNSFLDVVKERATAAGNTLAELVAFWHNCDYELIYALFGSAILVLIGAFIGKWGHS